MISAIAKLARGWRFFSCYSVVKAHQVAQGRSVSFFWNEDVIAAIQYANPSIHRAVGDHCDLTHGSFACVPALTDAQTMGESP